jgi:hypothetical protein
MFAPTGRPLRKGDGYFSDHYVVFPGFAYGLTDNVNVSGGFSVVPGLNLEEQFFYVSSTVGWKLSKKAAFSLGGLYATGSEANEAGALLFGVASLVERPVVERGLGLAATRNEELFYDAHDRYVRSERRWSFREAPILMVGGTFRVSKRISLVTESWLLAGRDFRLSATQASPFASSASAFRWMPVSSWSPKSSTKLPYRGCLSPITSALRGPAKRRARLPASTADDHAPADASAHPFYKRQPLRGRTFLRESPAV